MTMLTTEEKAQLDVDGYLLLPGFCEVAQCQALRARIEQLFLEEGERAGAEFKLEEGSRRLANLVDKGEVILPIIANAQILAYVRHVLGPVVKLSSLNARAAEPGTGWVQPLHADMAAIADEQGFWVCNTLWMLDDFTPENGPLRVIPGSHHWGRLPQDELDDPRATRSDEVVITGKAGDVLILNAHVWHGGMENRTDRSRLALHAFYCRRDKPQQQDQKKLIRSEIQATLTAEVRELLALDDVNVLADVQMPRSGFL